MIKTNRRKTKKNTKPIITGLALLSLALILGGIWYLSATRNQASTKATNPGSTTQTPPPASTNSASSTPINTNTAADTKSNATTGGTSGSTTSVTITSVDQTHVNTVSISAYASTVASSGTCTFTFTQGQTQFTKTTTVLQNPSTSSCETLTLNNSDFPDLGTWQFVVTFSAGNITGTSPITTLVLK